MEFKANCFTFQGPLNPGDYTIPFEFNLPNGIPSSIMFKDKNIREKPSAKIKYSIKAIIHTHDKKMLKYKQMLVIHEPPVDFKENANTQQTVALKTCCCFDKGQGSMQAAF
jgi:hypothetical protein